MRSRGLALATVQLLAGVGLAGEPSAAPPPRAAPGAITQALLAVLDLPVRIGDPWEQTQQSLYIQRCLPEDAALFAAMDCRSDLVLGPFSAAGPEGSGLTVYSDDAARITRIAASRATAEKPVDCNAFQAGVSRALAGVDVPSKIARTPEGLRLRAGAAGDLQLTVECQPKAQTLELGEPWLYLVPGGNCPVLQMAPSDLLALTDSAMTGDIHNTFDDPGLACNRAGFELFEYAGQLMDALIAAYAARKSEVPGAPPDWLVGQIRGGFADVRRQAAALAPDCRRRLEAYLQKESTTERLGTLWSKVKNGELAGPRTGGTGPSPRTPKRH